MPRRRKVEERIPGAERWLVSYADFITLLFAFFTTLYAISNVDLQKMHRLVSSLHVAFDSRAQAAPAQPAPAGRASKSGPRPPTDPATLAASLQAVPDLPPGVLAELGHGYLEAALREVKDRLEETLAAAVKDGRVSLDIDRRGLVISIREAGSFKTGSAELAQATRTLLREVGVALKTIDHCVRVEGHTDDVPIHTTRYASNWELSTARATAVVAFLIQEFDLPPDRLSAAGYGEFHPRVPNADVGSRARNRRVDIVLLNQTISLAEEPPSDPPR